MKKLLSGVFGAVVLVILAILNNVVSLFYYLFIVKAAYYSDPKESFPKLVLRPVPRYAAIAITLAVLVLGCYPQPLVAYLSHLNLAMTMLP